MAQHDPNINFYDNPGHPYWPSSGNWHEDGVVPGGGGSERVELFNETVTTEQNEMGSYSATLAYIGNITDDPLHVVFDGVEYELPRSEAESSIGEFVTYGTFIEGIPDFSTYPLALENGSLGLMVDTETAGTHTIVAFATPTPMPTLGSMQPWPYVDTIVPVVGNVLSGDRKALSLSVGETTICDNVVESASNIGKVASGVTISINNAIGTTDKLYAIVVDSINLTISSVRELDIEVEANSFVMPELEEDEVLYIKYTRGIS